MEEPSHEHRLIPNESASEGADENLDNLITKAEEKTVELQHDIRSLSDTIRENLVSSPTE